MSMIIKKARFLVQYAQALLAEGKGFHVPTMKDVYRARPQVHTPTMHDVYRAKDVNQRNFNRNLDQTKNWLAKRDPTARPAQPQPIYQTTPNYVEPGLGSAPPQMYATQPRVSVPQAAPQPVQQAAPAQPAVQPQPVQQPQVDEQPAPPPEMAPQPQAQQQPAPQAAPQQAQQPKQVPVQPAGNMYEVQPFDTLSGIAQKHNMRWQDLQRLNPQVTNPNRIYPGQQLRVK